MGSLVRSGIFPGLYAEKSWKNWKYKMTKYKNTNIKTSKVQIQPKNKLENLSYGLSRSKWHLPWAFRNRRIAADILSRSGLHKIRRMRFRNFFDKILSRVFVQNASLSPYMHFTNTMVDKKKKQCVHGKEIYLTEINILRHQGLLKI